MRSPKSISTAISRFSIFTAALSLILSMSTIAWSQAGTSDVEQIDANSIIIAMDNSRQGDTDGGGPCDGPDFNLRAYGLAVHLLHANVPLKWAIKDKATKDEADFVADVTQLVGDIGGGINVGGQDCTTETANTPFPGGPIIIPALYRAAALQVIEDFNASSTSTNDVRVYNVNANFVAPIRYTLTHKPFVAVGPEGGGFGTGVYASLMTSAGLVENSHYGFVANNVFQTNACVTLAAQAHASDDAINFIGTYRSFAENGGNLLLQCKSVNVFENAAAPNGRFQSTLGWTTFGDSGGEVDEIVSTFPNPAMAFNQFVGNLGDARGNVSEYQLAPSSVFQNGTLIAARNNSTGNTAKYVATVSKIGSATAGGSVFELGGHQYSNSSNTDGSALERLNGSRMALNTLLIPAVRPGCNLAIDSVKAFKSVAMSTELSTPNGVPNYGETVEWTIRYINDGVGTITNFQITDSLDTLPTVPAGSNRLDFVEGSLDVSATGVGTSATANGSYDPNNNINMLSTGTLAPGGMITVKIKTKIQGFNTILNQATGTGTGLNSPVKTDTTDSTTSGTVAGYPVACPGGNCLSQAAYSAAGTNEDPTGIDLTTAPTSAPARVSGLVSDNRGRGLAREQVLLQSASTGEVRTVLTNSFGRFTFDGVPTGSFYVVQVVSRRYRFETPSYSFDLVDNLSDLVFIGSESKGVPPAPATGKSVSISKK